MRVKICQLSAILLSLALVGDTIPTELTDRREIQSPPPAADPPSLSPLHHPHGISKRLTRPFRGDPGGSGGSGGSGGPSRNPNEGGPSGAQNPGADAQQGAAAGAQRGGADVDVEMGGTTPPNRSPDPDGGSPLPGNPINNLPGMNREAQPPVTSLRDLPPDGDLYVENFFPSSPAANWQHKIVWGKHPETGENVPLNEYLVNQRAVTANGREYGALVTRDVLLSDGQGPGDPTRLTSLNYKDVLVENYMDANGGSADNLRFFGTSDIQEPRASGAIARALGDPEGNINNIQVGEYKVSLGSPQFTKLTTDNPFTKAPEELAAEGRLGPGQPHLSTSKIYVTDASSGTGKRVDMMLVMVD